MRLEALAIEFLANNEANVMFAALDGEVTSDTAFELAHRFNTYPALLAACEAALAWLDAMGLDDHAPTDTLRSAIAAARGGAA